MARLTDEIVDKIHAVRLKHAAQFDNDRDRILDNLVESQQHRVALGWPVIDRLESTRPVVGRLKPWNRFAQRVPNLKTSGGTGFVINQP